MKILPVFPSYLSVAERAWFFILRGANVLTLLFLVLPIQMFAGIRENISPTIAALASILILFSTSLLLILEWLRGRNKAAARI